MLQVNTDQGWLSFLLFIIFMVVMTFYGQKIQLFIWINEIERQLKKLKMFADESKEKLAEAVSRHGKKKKDALAEIENFSHFFIISPVDLDPAGVLKRLEYLLDTGKGKLESYVSALAPKADEISRNNYENMLEACIALDYIYRVVRHFLMLGKRTQSTIIVMQIHMQLPQIMEIASSYFKALDSFSLGVPIGDGIGALVAFKLAHGFPYEEIVKDTIVYSGELENRKLYVVKAKGPGGNVGKPGEAVKKLVSRARRRIKRAIIVDAAVKLEGEKTGEVAEGVGAAIGDPGPEKYKIEEVMRRNNIPIDAIVIKQSIADAITTMKKEIALSADKVVEKIKDIIRTKTAIDDVVLVIGVGNTMGVGQ